MSQLCFPYSTGITCVCDASNRIFRCFPELSKKVEETKNSESPLYQKFCDILSIFNGRTESILAATCLLIIIFAFCGFLTYRCERIIINLRKDCLCCKQLKSRCGVSVQTEFENLPEGVRECAEPLYPGGFNNFTTTNHTSFFNKVAENGVSVSQSADYLLQDTCSIDKLDLFESRSYNGNIV
ncbi:uncharacterized protein LOC111713552 [Eurytemora carolleeae]|uniref:uncharacterized protein LOC111713552 n=1 Tax=Eurytemora carolleeae TaxID=1294199 RepID=UPI000C781234|nr:uncharacterized protein LOC111713552 [Eurytemora carolleeae]|eukprot:XP_023344202.1 uncharacterized protein LOC111713552 [Eurytemora affinis]